MTAPKRSFRFQRIPENEIPALVPLAPVLNRTEDLVVWLTDLHAYSTGFSFTVHARRRTSDLMLDVYGFGKPSPSHASAPLLLGLGYADGTFSSNLPGRNNDGGLRHHGGSGGGGHARTSYFRHQLPPAGVIQIVTAWPFFSMPECIIELDGTLIVDAAKRVETLWPESNGSGPLFAGDHTQHPLELAPGGWFESHYSPTTNRPGEHGKGRYTITGENSTRQLPNADSSEDCGTTE
jgi:hypothetical protein